jgi:chemotaxis protein methyltransferase CheR
MLDREDFIFLAEFLRHRSGLVLTSQKPRFAESRLQPVMRRFGFKSLAALIDEIKHDRETLAAAVTEALTVNDSAFFRDRGVFDTFRDAVLPDLVNRQAGEKHLRIWSAACAAGQEPYSIAMLLEDAGLRAAGWTIDLIATDISGEMIARAGKGLYSPFEIQRGLSEKRLAANFESEGRAFRIDERLRRMVTFRTLNLLDSFGSLWETDIVFCRNVLMYFDQKTRAAVLDKISDILAPAGVLLIGANEMVLPPAGLYAHADFAPGFYFKSKDAAQNILAVG